MNNSICPKIKLVQDTMVVLITCMSDEDSTKNEIAVVRTTFSEVNGPSYANSRNQANIKLVRDFDICSRYLRFMKIQSRSSRYRPDSISPLYVFGRLRFYRFPLPLSVWKGLQFVILALPGLFSYLFSGQIMFM